MSVYTLREAAARMRAEHGPDHERHEMWSAMADLLNVTAERLGTPGHRDWHAPEAAALTVARSYLKAAARKATRA